ncbi:MAG: hypothetical protein V4604_06555 [Bacteroidota bacterium]
MPNKLITFLIVATLLGGLGILIAGLMAIDFQFSQRPLLSIAGAMLFSSALVALSIHSKRSN